MYIIHCKTPFEGEKEKRETYRGWKLLNASEKLYDPLIWGHNYKNGETFLKGCENMKPESV